jgi:hypothetical protein
MYSNTSAELSIGTNAAAKLGQATLYVGGDISGSGNLNIDGSVTSSFTGSFVGDGSGLTSVPTPSGTVSGSAQIDHDSTTNFVANEHIDWTGASAGTIHASNYTDTTTNTQLSQEQVEDFVGGMLDGTETGITVGYDDTNGNLDFVVATQTANDFTNTLKTKLDAIEAEADITDATNVLANLPSGIISGSAQLAVSISGSSTALSSSIASDVATNTAKATNVSTNLTITGTTEARVIASSDGTNATIPVATTSVSGLMNTTLFDKLDGIEAGSDITDATNVLANLPAGVVSSSTFPFTGDAQITGSIVVSDPGELALDVYGSTKIYKSGSVGDTDVLTIEGGFGTLFSVTDELSGSLFSVNDISGIPIFEVFSDDTVKIGTHNQEGIVVNGKNVVITGSLAIGALTGSRTAGRIDASNDVVAFSTSDRRWKDNITPIESPLQKLLELGGYEFDWREDSVVHGNKGHDVGVIAQEVEAVLPEAVQTRSSGMKAVRYEKIIPLLIETIKEQQKQIDKLKNRIK